LIAGCSIGRPTAPVHPINASAQGELHGRDLRGGAAKRVDRARLLPHDLAPLRTASPGFLARHHCAAFDAFSISDVAHGGSVVIDPGYLERFLLVQIPARVRTAARDIGCVPDVAASHLSSTVATEMLWQNDCAQLIPLVERKPVEQLGPSTDAASCTIRQGQASVV
jgi:hypothetical protein